MSQYTRHIDVESNLVFFDPINKELNVEMDCSSFLEQNIIFVCEERDQMWLEYFPFTGRVYDFDKEPVERFFEEAKQKWIIKNDHEMSLIDVTPITNAYNGLLAIHQLGFSTQYEEWVNSSERTFLERAFFTHSVIWRKDDTVLLAALTSFGLVTDEQLNDFFELANTL